MSEEFSLQRRKPIFHFSIFNSYFSLPKPAEMPGIFKVTNKHNGK